jgi:septal ring factor EnvC (AmiA/AmiB activator)
MTRLVGIAALLMLAVLPAAAQDVRGLEVCTAEKQMERRTGCLQSNVEFLQQTLQKNAADARQQLAGASAQIAAASKEIAALKDALAKMQARVEELEKKGAKK